jgi:hypothetical protein
MSFDPDSSVHIVSWSLAIFIMARHPISPPIMIARDPHLLPGSWNPFPSNFPVTWNIFRFWRIPARLWGRRHMGSNFMGYEAS